MIFALQLLLYTEHFSHILVSKWISVPVNNEPLKWLEVKKLLLPGIKSTFLHNPLHPAALFWEQAAAPVDNPLQFEWAISREPV